MDTLTSKIFSKVILHIAEFSMYFSDLYRKNSKHSSKEAKTLTYKRLICTKILPVISFYLNLAHEITLLYIGVLSFLKFSFFTSQFLFF